MGHSHPAEPDEGGPNPRANARKGGPAQVKTVGEEYRRALATRWRDLRGLVRTSIATNDAVRLGDQSGRRRNAEPAEDFAFTTRAERVDAFREWFKQALDDEVLVPADDVAVRAGRHYTATYVRTGYDRGLSDAAERLRRAGHDLPDDALDALGNAPVHRDSLELLYSRNYQGLQGIGADAEQSMSRLLTEGFAAGRNPRPVADDMTAELRDIQHARLRTLARTEVMNAHHQAAMNRYERFGVGKVVIVTNDPCPQCQGIAADAPFERGEARGLLPAHPNCVCAVAPVPESISGRGATTRI